MGKTLFLHQKGDSPIKKTTTSIAITELYANYYKNLEEGIINFDLGLRVALEKASQKRQHLNRVF